MRQRGFSLIELVIFIVVMGIAIAAIGIGVRQSVARSAEPLLRQKAVALAGFYMDEVLRKKWNEATPTEGGCVDTGSGICAGGNTPTAIGPEADELSGGKLDRRLADDIDDYNGISNEVPTDQDNNALGNFSGYEVSVSVAEPGSPWNGLDQRDVRVITVTVDTPSGESLKTRAYRVNF